MYTIQAIPTVYQGRRYRSRLEAKWASFFNSLGWRYEYEPVDFGIWSPDFAILGASGPIYVEVKPIYAFSRETYEKIIQVPGEHLLLGVSPLASNEYPVSGGHIGWWCDNEFPGGADAELTLVSVNGAKKWGLISTSQSWHDRISGEYDGDHHLIQTGKSPIGHLWAKSTNAVQWHKR